jgi:hypothetical protein
MSPYILNQTSYAVENSYYTGSIEERLTTEIKTVSDTSYRSIDFKKLLISMHNQSISRFNDCYFMGTEKIVDRDVDRLDRLAAMDTVGDYTYVNTSESLVLLNSIVSQFSQSYGNAAALTSLEDIFNSADDSSDWLNNETIAYRIEKTTQTQTEPTRTATISQNFWFYNKMSLDGTEFRFYDSQVKYGEDYTYNVYAYVVGRGLKYNFSDLRVTKQIASGSVGEDDETFKYYCLEFENSAGSTSDQLYYLSEPDSVIYSEEAYAALSDESNEFLTGSGAHMISENPYIADMYLHYEPTLKIFEMPIYSKTLKVMDHPPNQLEISPYQLMNNSQKIGFSFLKDTFVKAEYPDPISSNDEAVRQAYLHANDIVDGIEMEVENKQISRTKHIEVYRIDTKPTAVTDFDQNLLERINLTIPDNARYTYPTHNFHDTIKTNQKYYYLFRGLNEHFEPGYLSDIYQVELVDDGGYKYALFDVIRKTDLEQDTYTETIKSFKKLLEVVPNVSHTALGTSDVDFDSEAYTQIEDVSVGTAEDLIWGKTFKLRLTSKKTGKKIDLNITYILETET